MPHTEGMIVLALLGVAVNGLAAYKLSGGKTLNERVLNWHLLEDVLGWIAVLLGYAVCGLACARPAAVGGLYPCLFWLMC